MIPTCGHVGCTEPGTVTTRVQGCHRPYELHHCPTHAGDAPKIATALGFDVLSVKALAA